jgi:hypothetical protein
LLVGLDTDDTAFILSGRNQPGNTDWLRQWHAYGHCVWQPVRHPHTRHPHAERPCIQRPSVQRPSVQRQPAAAEPAA